MQVAAFSSPGQPDWRWRIVNYAGDVVEESQRTFPSIHLAVEHGMSRLRQLDGDRSAPRPVVRLTARPRRPPRGGA